MLIFSSCTPKQNMVYMGNNNFEQEVSQARYEGLHIQEGDVLEVIVSAFDELVLKNEKNLAKDLADLSQNLPTDNPELLEAIKFYNKAGDWQAREKADFSAVKNELAKVENLNIV